MEENHEVPGYLVADHAEIDEVEVNDTPPVQNDIEVHLNNISRMLEEDKVLIMDDTGEPMVADIVDLDDGAPTEVGDIPELPLHLIDNILNQTEARNENIMSDQTVNNQSEVVLPDQNSIETEMDTDIDTSDDSGDTIVNMDQPNPNSVINVNVPNIIISHPLQNIEENLEDNSSRTSSSSSISVIDMNEDPNTLLYGGLHNGIEDSTLRQNAMLRRMNIIRSRSIVNQIGTINLDLCVSPAIVGLTDEFVNLRHLSLLGVGLVTLEGFPVLPQLTKLVLSLNNITDGLHLLRHSPLLRFLDLSVNPLRDFDVLLPLRLFANLRYLDLHRSSIPNVETRRMDIFNLIPSLLYLDLFDINMRRVTSFQIQRECAFEDV